MFFSSVIHDKTVCGENTFLFGGREEECALKDALTGKMLFSLVETGGLLFENRL